MPNKISLRCLSLGCLGWVLLYAPAVKETAVVVVSWIHPLALVLTLNSYPPHPRQSILKRGGHVYKYPYTNKSKVITAKNGKGGYRVNWKSKVKILN